MVADVARAVGKAEHVVVLTGAGASAESGVPTFRDALAGLWARFDPAELATPGAFAADPALVSRWYDGRRVAVLACEPNAGHLALVGLAERVPRLTLLTQNVDRLHQRAGSTGVVELHGTLLAWRCTSCAEEREELGPAFGAYPPRCDACGGLRRPAVVWFGEPLPAAALVTATSAAASCDVFLSVGTSGVVYPAAGLAEVARRAGATTVEVNPAATDASGGFDVVVRGTAGAVLPAIVGAMREGRAGGRPGWDWWAAC